MIEVCFDRLLVGKLDKEMLPAEYFLGAIFFFKILGGVCPFNGVALVAPLSASGDGSGEELYGLIPPNP